MQIIDFMDEKNKEKFVVVNLYVNPTEARSERNQENIEKLRNVLELTSASGGKVIFGSDANQKASEIRKMLLQYGLDISKVGKTRLEGRKEIDVLATNMGS